MKDKKIVIIDYELSNLFSVARACEVLGYTPVITRKHTELVHADAVILPGVGAFKEAMTNLLNLHFIDAVYTYIEKGKPFMGVCLGLQLLFEVSEEFGTSNGLGLIKGAVKKFRPNVEQNLKVPQIGWNKISPKNRDWSGTPFQTVPPESFMYFVHSYYAVAADEEDILSTTTYGETTYCSSVLKGNIFATQFHPEKSGEPGLVIYKNWLNNV